MTRFAGYAAVFDEVDQGGDIIKPGAFTRSLKNGPVPLLLQHRQGRVAGTIETLAEDNRGLRVIARLGRDAVGKRAEMLMSQGRLKGLSFGYRVRRGAGEGPHRTLQEVDLVEVSLVERPMQPLAKVHAVESE